MRHLFFALTLAASMTPVILATPSSASTGDERAIFNLKGTKTCIITFADAKPAGAQKLGTFKDRAEAEKKLEELRKAGTCK